MSKKQKLKASIDMTMLLLLPLLMGYSLMGEFMHEIMGILMFLLFILHHVLNQATLKNIFHGRYTLTRILNTAVNLALLFVMIALPVSGIMLSRHLFAFLPISGGLIIARTVHLAASYWGMLTCTGYYLMVWLNQLQKSGK